VNCLAGNSDVKPNSPWVFLFFIYSLFHTEFCRFDVWYNDIRVSISSQESESELRAMNSAIAHFARLQETTSQCALTLCHAVLSVLRLPALRPPASAYVSMCARPKAPDFLTFRPHLPQEKSLVLTFRGRVDLRAHGSVGGTMEKNPQWHRRESIPGLSD